MDNFQCLSLDEAAVHIASLRARVEQLEKTVHMQGEMIDTLWTPLHKKIWFWINGWPLYKLADQPKHRFWQKWTGI